MVAFLATHHATHDDQPVIVATGDRRTLETIHSRAPGAIRLLSISSPAQFETLTRDPALVQLIDGVTIQQMLLNEERMTWLQGHDLMTFAWTVNDLERTNELVRLGVDGITTDNLAIMEILGGQPPGETRWKRASRSETAGTGSGR